MSKTYTRIDINGKEENLPKEEGRYFAHMKTGSLSCEPFYNDKSWRKTWIKVLDWYLVESDLSQLQSMEEINDEKICQGCGENKKPNNTVKYFCANPKCDNYLKI